MFTTPPLIKKLILLALLTISASTISAQHYRGFVDAYGLLRIQSAPSKYHIPTGSVG